MDVREFCMHILEAIVLKLESSCSKKKIPFSFTTLIKLNWWSVSASEPISTIQQSTRTFVQQKPKCCTQDLFHIYPPGAVEVVLTLAAASGDRGWIEPEGRPAVPIAAALISIITVEQQSTSTPQPIDISIWKRTYCHPGHSRPCLICLFITADQGPVWRRLIIIMYRLRQLSTSVSLPSEVARGNKRCRGVWCRYRRTDWLTDSHVPAGVSNCRMNFVQHSEVSKCPI